MPGAPPTEKYAWVYAVYAQPLQSPLTLCDPLECSLPGSSVHGIFQARMLEWVVTYFSRGSSPPRDRACISGIFCTAGRFFTAEPLGSPLKSNPIQFKLTQSTAGLEQGSPQERPHARSRECTEWSFQKLEN